MKKNLFILNYPAHYRLPIYNKISDELNADFYFGDIPNSNIKKIENGDLNNFRGVFKTIKLNSFYWYVGMLKLIFKPYQNYILTGDPFIISNWIFLILAKILKKRTILWSHGMYGRESNIRVVLKKMYFSLADKLFLYGNYSKDLLIKHSFKSKKIHVIYNSLDYDNQLDIRIKLQKSDVFQNHFQNHNRNLIFIGRVQKSKKLEQVLDAMILLKKNDNLNINFTIIGGVEKDYDFLEQVNQRNLSQNVWLLGECYDEYLNGQFLFNADVCVSPGDIGLTAIHSLMFNTPVITHSDFKHQGPEFESIIHNVNGAFFLKNNIIDLAEKIKMVLQSNYTNCSQVVDEVWNPSNQIELMKKALQEF